MSAASVTRAVIAAHVQAASLNDLLDQLGAADRVHNMDRIGLVAMDLETAAMALAKLASNVIERAETLRCRQWDFSHPPVVGFDVEDALAGQRFETLP